MTKTFARGVARQSGVLPSSFPADLMEGLGRRERKVRWQTERGKEGCFACSALLVGSGAVVTQRQGRRLRQQTARSFASLLLFIFLSSLHLPPFSSSSSLLSLLSLLFVFVVIFESVVHLISSSSSSPSSPSLSAHW